MQWVEVATGRFEMGSDALAGRSDDDEGPPRMVTVGRFWISDSPVTQAAFLEFVEQTGYETTAMREGNSFAYQEDAAEPRLVEGLSWSTGSARDAVIHVSWSDAQAFCRWHRSQLPTEAQWERAASNLGYSKTVWQWCRDYYQPTFHRDEQRVNPIGPNSGLERVARGGHDRLTARGHFLPDMTSDQLGFRVVTTSPDRVLSGDG